MFSNVFILTGLFVCLSCNRGTAPGERYHSLPVENIPAANDENPYRTIGKIPLPIGYKRVNTGTSSFTAWLLNVDLKKDKTVYLFNGRPKANQQAQYAVLNLSVGNRDLQQCADAVMRLRAEYLFSIQQYGSIRFTDNEGKKYAFGPPFTHANLLAYLQRVFSMCGSASLSKQLKPVPFNTIQAGDVLIRGGFPGHAVIVMDVAENDAGKKIYLLAQSYMPAQDIHVLVNPRDTPLSPWYAVDENAIVETPEYDFNQQELKRW